jgi:hypothetical protein
MNDHVCTNPECGCTFHPCNEPYCEECLKRGWRPVTQATTLDSVARIEDIEQAFELARN